MNFKPDRIKELDVMRGVALGGIFLVNMVDFSGSALRAGTFASRGTMIDQGVDLAIACFALTKFYLLFSFLFGVGFAVQMQRMEETGRPFVRLYMQRLAVLLLIGIAHSILLWDGDILRLYAVAGVLLLMVRKVRTRVLLTIAAAITIAGTVYFSFVPLQNASTLMSPASITAYASGTYTEVVMLRASERSIIDIQIPMVFVMFLLGLVVGRENIIANIRNHESFLRRAWKGALPLGILGSIAMLVGYSTENSLLVSLSTHVGAPLLSFSYVALILLNTERLHLFAYAGRMALTNYLMHSLISTTLFYGYGFGLYDSLSAAESTLLALVILAAQIAISKWWLSHHRMGPMEWLWRKSAGLDSK
ncbi:MAG: DUF418 domain-containing protein [Bacteroidota bacterium]